MSSRPEEGSREEPARIGSGGRRVGGFDKAQVDKGFGSKGGKRMTRGKGGVRKKEERGRKVESWSEGRRKFVAAISAPLRLKLCGGCGWKSYGGFGDGKCPAPHHNYFITLYGTSARSTELPHTHSVVTRLLLLAPQNLGVNQFLSNQPKLSFFLFFLFPFLSFWQGNISNEDIAELRNSTSIQG